MDLYSRPHYLFENRREAGKELSRHLDSMRFENGTVVVALSRGGVLVGSEIALRFRVPLVTFFVSKLTVPGNPEETFGAVTETGEIFLNAEMVSRYEIPDHYIQQAISSKREEILRRQRLYHHETRPQFQRKNVIVVDDGATTGATLFVSLQALRNERVRRLIVGLPVLPQELAEKVAVFADESTFLHVIPFFSSVEAYYLRFEPVSREEVLETLAQVNEGRKAA